MLEFNLNHHKHSLLNPQLSEHELVTLVQKISRQFTSHRESIDEYVADRDYASAYTYFYLPTNYPKFDFLMKRLPSFILDQLAKCHFVDWGTGPGTYLLAFLTMFPQAKITGIDRSRIMLEQAKSSLDFYFPGYSANLRSDSAPILESEVVYLNFGNSLNEMTVAQVLKVIKHYDPKFISFIEPGTPAVFKKILDIRKHMGELKYNSFYPCSFSQVQCPVGLKQEEGIEDWCHQVLRMQHHHSVERFSQLVKLDRKSMPLIAHFYAKADLGQVRSGGVVVRFLRETKFSFDYQVCMNEDGEFVLSTIELLKKSLTKQEVKQYKKQSVGLELNFEIVKQLGVRHFRVTKKAD